MNHIDESYYDIGAPYQPPGPTEYGYGDYVKVELDKWLQHNLEEGNMHANLERLLPVGLSIELISHM